MLELAGLAALKMVEVWIRSLVYSLCKLALGKLTSSELELHERKDDTKPVENQFSRCDSQGNNLSIDSDCPHNIAANTT